MTGIRNRFTKNAYRYFSLLIIITFLSIGIIGCGASKYATDRSVSEMASKSEQAMEPVYVGRSNDGIQFDSVAYITASPSGIAAASELERKVIQNADMTVEVKDVAGSLDRVTKICEENGGYLVSSNVSRDEEWTRAEANIKVPYDKVNKVAGEIEGLGEMTFKKTSTEDVTEEYYDSQARLTVMKKKEERLLALMDGAKTVEEIIAVENELSGVQGDIEVLEGRLKYLNNMTSYSSIHITLCKAVPGSLEVPQGTLGKAGQAFVSSVNAMVDFLSNLFIGLISFVPWAVLLVLGYLILRALVKQRRWSFHIKRKKNPVNPIPPEEDKKE